MGLMNMARPQLEGPKPIECIYIYIYTLWAWVSSIISNHTYEYLKRDLNHEK